MVFNLFFKGSKTTVLTAFLLVNSLVAQAEEQSGSSATNDFMSVSGFPQWPNRVQANKEMVPPPPPGPYMSTALSDYSVKGSRFKHGVSRPEMGFDVVNPTIDSFSPDIPWPDDLRTPRRWVPEKGYTFAPPPVKRNVTPARPSNNNNYGYNYRPNGMNNMLPTMGFNSNKPRQLGPQNMPSGGYSSGPRYPANNYGQSTKPVNRTPYPVSNEPGYRN